MSLSPPSPPVANQATSGDNNDGYNNLQIFLGGSCNPTTWRRNVAIPYLELNGISYYNPQVDDWTPEAVDSERFAKQNAQILLFVIDKQTRSTVSLVESAYIAGENKNLVIVIYPFEYNVISLTDTCKQASNVIETESKLMRTSQTRFINNKNRNESSSYLHSTSSTTTSSTLISASVNASSLTSTMATRALSTRTNLTSAISSKLGSNKCNQIDEKSVNAIHEEAMQTCGTIKINDEVISLGEFQELKQARYILQNLLIIQDIPMFSDILQALKYVSSSLGGKSSGSTREFQQNSLRNSSNSTDEDNSPQTQPFDPLQNHRQVKNRQPQEQLEGSSLENRFDFTNQRSADGDSITSRHDTMLKDVYLSLDSDDHLNIETTIIPILKEKGLTYYHMSVNNMIKSSYTTSTVIEPKLSIDSQQPTTSTKSTTIDINEDLIRYSSSKFDTERSESTKLSIENEICAIRSSRVLLFVVTNKCRGLSIMVLASHFMALFQNNVVLCVQYLEEPCSIGGETLSKAAIADYNRGRVYLCDYAIKSQVPVFSTIREAIDCCSRKCGYSNKS